MQDGKPPATPTSKATPSKSATTAPVSSANGEKQGGAGKAGPPGGRGGGGGGEGLAGIAAKMMGAKGKKQESPETSGVNETGRQGRNGCVDDLPLGSEAHSLSQDQTNGIDRNLAPADKRYSLSNTGVMGWQSFNSDVSNQTSASSASLEMLLNERQVDPEEMLLNLGFGGQGQSYVPYLARVPQRFLHHPSRAYGIDLPDVTDRVDGEGGDETVTGTPVGNSGTSAAAPPAKKRTGGFYFLGLYFWSCYGYVDLVNLVLRDVPLHFFNEEGTKCYVTSRTAEGGIKRIGQKRGESTVDSSKSRRRLTRVKTKRSSTRVGTGMKERERKGSERKGMEEEGDFKKRGRKVGGKRNGLPSPVSSKENVIPEEELKPTALQSEEPQPPERHEKRFGRFLDMTYLKTAAKKIGDTITGKISRKQQADAPQSQSRSNSASPKAQRHLKANSSHVESPLSETKCESLSSSLSSLPAYPHLTSKLKISSLLPSKKDKKSDTVSIGALETTIKSSLGGLETKRKTSLESPEANTKPSLGGLKTKWKPLGGCETKTKPSLVGSETKTKPSLGGPETKTKPSLGGPETKTKPSLGGQETKTKPSLGGSETKTKPSLGGPETKTKPSLGGPETKTKPSLGGPETKTKPSLGGPETKTKHSLGSSDAKTKFSSVVENTKRNVKTTSAYPHLVSKLSVMPFIGGSNIISQNAKVKDMSLSHKSSSNTRSTEGRPLLQRAQSTKDGPLKKMAADSKSKSEPKEATKSIPSGDIDGNKTDTQELTTISKSEQILTSNPIPHNSAASVESFPISENSTTSPSHSAQSPLMLSSVSSNLSLTSDPVFVEEIQKNRNVLFSPSKAESHLHSNALPASHIVETSTSENKSDQSVAGSQIGNTSSLIIPHSSTSQTLETVSSYVQTSSAIPNLENIPPSFLSDRRDDVCNVTFVCDELRVNPTVSDSQITAPDSSNLSDSSDGHKSYLLLDDNNLEIRVPSSSTIDCGGNSDSSLVNSTNRNVVTNFKAKTNQESIATVESESCSNIIDSQMIVSSLSPVTNSFSNIENVPATKINEISSQNGVKGNLLDGQNNEFSPCVQNDMPVCSSESDNIVNSTSGLEHFATDTQLNDNIEKLNTVTCLAFTPSGCLPSQDSDLGTKESLAPCGSNISGTLEPNIFDLSAAVASLENDEDDDISSVDDMNCTEDSSSDYEDTQDVYSTGSNPSEYDSEDYSSHDIEISENSNGISDDQCGENDDSDTSYGDVLEDADLEWCYDGESLNLNQLSVTPSAPCDILPVSSSTSCDSPLRHSLLINPRLSPNNTSSVSTTSDVPYATTSLQEFDTEYHIQHISMTDMYHSEQSSDLYSQVVDVKVTSTESNNTHLHDVTTHFSIRKSSLKTATVSSSPYTSDLDFSRISSSMSTGESSVSIIDSSPRNICLIPANGDFSDDIANLKFCTSEPNVAISDSGIESLNSNVCSLILNDNTFYAQSLEKPGSGGNVTVDCTGGGDEGIEHTQNPGVGCNSSTLSGISEEGPFTSPLYKTLTTEGHSDVQCSVGLSDKENTSFSSTIAPTRPTHFNIARNRKTLSSEQRYVCYIKTVEPRKADAKPKPVSLLKRRTSTGSLRPLPLTSPSSLPSSNSSYSWMIPSKSADAFDQLSERDKQGVDMSNVSTSSSDSEDEGMDRRGNTFSPSFPEKRLWFS